jgi:hypothetical protein
MWALPLPRAVTDFASTSILYVAADGTESPAQGLATPPVSCDLCSDLEHRTSRQKAANGGELAHPERHIWSAR